jgi:GGDEF domain-containing protein
MKRLAEAVASSGTDLGSQVEHEIGRLETAASTRDLNVILNSIRDASTGLRSCYEQMQKTNEVTIAQLQDEIRMLHRDREEERRTMHIDKHSGAWIRQKIDTRIEDLLRQGEAFWVLFMRWELKTDVEMYPNAPDQVMHAMVKRVQTLLGKDALIGRWSQHMFATIIELDPSTEADMTRDLRAHVGGMYSIQENGMNIPVCINLQTGAATCPRGTKAIDFLPKLGQVTGHLGAP